MPNAEIENNAERKNEDARNQYRIHSRAFIADALLDPVRQWCPVALIKYNEKILVSSTHHKFGRLGPLLLWQPGWMAVSMRGHEYIHKRIKKARTMGWYAPLGFWNNPKAIAQFPDGIIR